MRTYAPLNRLAGITRPNGVTSGYSDDLAGRLAGLSHTGANGDNANQSFTYLPSGPVAAANQTRDANVWSGQPTSTTNVTHDALNRDAAITAAGGLRQADQRRRARLHRAANLPALTPQQISLGL